MVIHLLQDTSYGATMYAYRENNDKSFILMQYIWLVDDIA